MPGQLRPHQGQATEDGNYAEAGPVTEAIDVSEIWVDEILTFETFLF